MKPFYKQLAIDAKLYCYLFKIETKLLTTKELS